MLFHVLGQYNECKLTTNLKPFQESVSDSLESKADLLGSVLLIQP